MTADDRDAENRCATCKHWTNPWGDADWSAPVLEVEQPAVWGTCEKIAMHDSYDAVIGDDVLAFTKDGSNFVADLHTRDTFGCVLWEADQ